MLQPPLTDVELRVLGALVEKEATTPDVYPLSLAGLVAACNQTTNREPVMQLGEGEVIAAATALRRRDLLRAIQPVGSRVMKYQHLLRDALRLDARTIAVLGVLMLRGAQTPGELHARTARLAEFDGIEAVEAALQRLADRTPVPLAAALPRRPGQKETRWTHLMGGTPSAPAEADEPVSGPGGRVEALERRVEALETELAVVRGKLEELLAQLQ